MVGGTEGMILMYKNIPVLYANYNTFECSVNNESLLPYQLKNKFGQISGNPMRDTLTSLNSLQSFLSRRVLTLDRANAKKILNLIGASQAVDDATRAEIAAACKGVSVLDSYWIRSLKDNTPWESVDIRRNSLNRVIAQVALHGSSLTLQGKVQTPELTTNGTYAKAWKRINGELYLYKMGYNGDVESEAEVEVSNILDKSNVRHVRYEDASSEGRYCCRCKCMTDDNVHIISALDFGIFLESIGKDLIQFAVATDPHSMYKMCIVDYLVSNRDRHDGNWGFSYTVNNGLQLLGCHPLFDHNNSFDKAMMQDRNGGQSQIFRHRSTLEAAQYSLKRTEFKLSGISGKEFKHKEHFESFKEKCNILGINYR